MSRQPAGYIVFDKDTQDIIGAADSRSAAWTDAKAAWDGYLNPLHCDVIQCTRRLLDRYESDGSDVQWKIRSDSGNADIG